MTLEDLICKAECQDLILRHARHLDECNFAESKQSYTADAVMVTPTGAEVKIADMGDDTLRRAATGLKPRIVTNILITPTGPDTADGFAYVTLPRKLVSQGEWLYKFRKTDQGWRVCWYRANGLEREKGELEELGRQARARAEAEAQAQSAN